jgi:hypothetical protein
MTFGQELVITLIDSLVIGGLLVVVGWWLNLQLEKFRSQQEWERQQQTRRVNSYQNLWSLTEAVSPSVKRNYTEAEKDILSQRLRAWYYAEGGIYLPQKTADLYLKAKNSLEGGSTPDEIRDAFSSLRTQIKVDVGTIDEEQATVQIGPQTAPDATQ